MRTGQKTRILISLVTFYYPYNVAFIFRRGYDVFLHLYPSLLYRGCDVFTFIFLTFTFCRGYSVFYICIPNFYFFKQRIQCVFTFVFLASAFLFIEDTMCFYICIPHFCFFYREYDVFTFVFLTFFQGYDVFTSLTFYTYHRGYMYSL